MKLLTKLFMAAVIGAALSACESTSDVRTGVPSVSDGTENKDSDTAVLNSGTDSTSPTGQDTDGSDTAEDEPLQLVCPDGPENPDTCYCLRMGVIGTFDSAAGKNDV